MKRKLFGIWAIPAVLLVLGLAFALSSCPGTSGGGGDYVPPQTVNPFLGVWYGTVGGDPLMLLVGDASNEGWLVANLNSSQSVESGSYTFTANAVTIKKGSTNYGTGTLSGKNLNLTVNGNRGTLTLIEDFGPAPGGVWKGEVIMPNGTDKAPAYTILVANGSNTAYITAIPDLNEANTGFYDRSTGRLLHGTGGVDAVPDTGRSEKGKAAYSGNDLVSINTESGSGQGAIGVFYKYGASHTPSRWEGRYWGINTSQQRNGNFSHIYGSLSASFIAGSSPNMMVNEFSLGTAGAVMNGTTKIGEYEVVLQGSTKGGLVVDITGDKKYAASGESGISSFNTGLNTAISGTATFDPTVTTSEFIQGVDYVFRQD